MGVATHQQTLPVANPLLVCYMRHSIWYSLEGAVVPRNQPTSPLFAFLMVDSWRVGISTTLVKNLTSTKDWRGMVWWDHFYSSVISFLPLTTATADDVYVMNENLPNESAVYPNEKINIKLYRNKLPTLNRCGVENVVVFV